MIATSEPESRREKLRALFHWIEGHDYPMRVSVRPYCRIHRDTLMDGNKSSNGVTHYYCPKCDESLKVKPRVV